MIEIKEVLTPKDLKAFVLFPFQLYQNHPYWVPSMIKNEMETFDPKNDIFKTVKAHFYLACRDQKIVGRIATIINWEEVHQLQKPKVRFGWFDFVDDQEVAEKLLQKAEDMAVAHNLQYVEGPMGFSNMDKAGMLTFGFDHYPTMIGLYNYDYYPKHLAALGYRPEAEWLEYCMNIDNMDSVVDVIRVSKLIEKRYKVKSIAFKDSNTLIERADEIFDLLNKTYADLQSFVPITKDQIEHYKRKYLKFIHPDFVSCVEDENGKMVAFAITMPSFSKAYQKANGKMFPFGWYHLLKAMKKNDHAEFYLIGIDPTYQNKGISALIFRDLYTNYQKRGITSMETNPLLVENTKVQQLWKEFSPEIHKRRSTFRKDVVLKNF